MKMILLNKEQADKVRGRHGVYSELQPIEISKDTYVLPVDVMDDPEHKEVLSNLGECKYADINMVVVADKEMEEKIVLSVKTVSPVLISVEKEMTKKPIYEKVLETIIKK